MVLEDETKGIARLLFGLGFPLGLIAIVGVFSLGMAIFHGEIDLNSKRLVLGAFLISFSASVYHLPRIYAATYFDGTRWHRFFSPSSLIWGVGFGIAAYFLGLRLLHLMRQ